MFRPMPKEVIGNTFNRIRKSICRECQQRAEECFFYIGLIAVMRDRGRVSEKLPDFLAFKFPLVASEEQHWPRMLGEQVGQDYSGESTKRANFQYRFAWRHCGDRVFHGIDVSVVQHARDGESNPSNKLVFRRDNFCDIRLWNGFV